MLKKFSMLIGGLILGTAISLCANDFKPELKFSGLIQVDAYYINAEKSNNSSGLLLSTLSLTADAKLNNKVNASITTLFEETANSNTNEQILIDEAKISWEILNNLKLTAGRMYLPFGVRNTNFVTSPFINNFSELTVTSAKLEYKLNDNFSVAYSMFNSKNINENKKNYNNHIRDFTIAANYASDMLEASLSYLSNPVEADFANNNTVNCTTGIVLDKGAALDFALKLKVSDFEFIGEYVGTIDDIQHEDYSTWDIYALNTELAYSVNEKLSIAGRYEKNEKKNTPWGGVSAKTKNTNYGCIANYTVFKDFTVSFEYLRGQVKDSNNTKTNSDNLTASLIYKF